MTDVRPTIGSTLQGRASVLPFVLLALPAMTLMLAFAAICWQAGTLAPWTQVVHEDGRHTLLQTIFYFEHASRELPSDLVLAVAIAGSLLYHFPEGVAADRRTRLVRTFALWSAGTILAIALGTIASVGTGGLLRNLAQLETRSGVAPVWGSHWRYHLLDRSAVMLLAFGSSGILRAAISPVARQPRRSRRARVFVLALALFAILTVLFGITGEPFRDARFLGHEARELLTHTLVTLPAALGVCLRMIVGPDVSTVSPPVAPAPNWPTGLTLSLAAALGLYVAIAAVITDAGSQGQSANLGTLIFPHFFEHALTYALVPAVAGFIYFREEKNREGRSHGPRG